MKIITNQILITGLALFAAVLLNSCKPIRDIKQTPLPYYGDNHFTCPAPAYAASKKNVFIIADKNGTEIFDMLAAFYLFNATRKTNVYIVARDRKPVVLRKNLFVLPQLTFRDVDSMKLEADVIVIPALSARTAFQDIVLIDWIKKHFHSFTKILAICDGASTAAATGLYDGKPMTCHASDYQAIKGQFPKVNWVQNVNVTSSGNLYSTAGVSNAVEGALTVINDLFDRQTMLKAAAAVYYPQAEIKTAHKSIAVSGSTKFNIAKKVICRKNKNTGVLLQEGMNEFWLASIIDTYGRSFPYSMSNFYLKDSTITTAYGLTIVCTQTIKPKKLHELHVSMPVLFSTEQTTYFSGAKIVRYDNQPAYPIDQCLRRIASLYGSKFENTVKILLDYN